MKILFIHQNFPGQFRESLPRLADSKNHQIVFLTQRKVDKPPPGYAVAVYDVKHKTAEGVHRLARLFDGQVAAGYAVRSACVELKKRGFVPDLVVGHVGWGETMFVHDVYPDAPLAAYFEYYFIPKGGAVASDPEFPEAPDVPTLLHARTAMNYLSLARAASGFTATEWQKQTFPKVFHPSMSVLHEGVRADLLLPDHTSPLTATVKGVRFSRDDELVTYIARNLEPMRGVHTMLRSLPSLQKARPNARVAVIGGDDVSYGQKLANNQTYRGRLVTELGDSVDWSRVHFLGNIPYPDLVTLLKLARVHIYLTVPFVVSWSMLEAMALEKVVIASDVAPVRQFIESGKNGVLVDFFKPQQLAEAMADVLARPDPYRPMREAARQTILATYDFNTIAYPEFERYLAKVATMKPSSAV
jgi:glycosyltransferase involved in cell wall biosynthesis